MVGPVSFVRTVLGDIDPSELGVTYAHEHLVIDGGRPVELEPDFDLADVDAMAVEVRGRDGARAAVRRRRDAVRRRPQRREARRAVAPDRRPHRRPDRAPPRALLRAGPLEPPDRRSRTSPTCSPPTSTDGIDALDYAGPVVRRTAHRAGVIKVAGSDGGPSRARPPGLRGRRRWRTAGRARRSSPTARPAPARSSRSALLTDLGVHGRHIALSHVDKVVDRGYHRELLGDGRLRRVRPGRSAGATRRTARSSCSAGWSRTASSTGSSLGMDAARQGYYQVYGGSPGLGWLLDGFTAADGRAGLDRRRSAQRLFVDNPARAFAFATVERGGDADDRRLLHQRRRLARAAVVVRVRDRGRGARRVRPGRPRGDARRRGRPRAARPGGGRHRRRERRRDAPRRLLHGRVLPARDRRPGAAAGPAAGRRRPRPAAPLRGARADRRARRPRRGRPSIGTRRPARRDR